MAMVMSKKQSGGSSRGRVASKRSINFAEIGKKQTNYTMLAPVILVALVLIGALVKFGFIDRLDEVERQKALTDSFRDKLAAANEKVESYDKLAEEYAHFTYSGMTEEEKTRSDRVDILNLIESEIRKRCTVKSWTINGNIVTVNIIAKDQLTIQTVKQAVELSPLVSGCSMPKKEARRVKDEKTGEITVTATATLKIMFNPKIRIKPVVKEEATSNEG